MKLKVNFTNTYILISFDYVGENSKSQNHYKSECQRTKYIFLNRSLYTNTIYQYKQGTDTKIDLQILTYMNTIASIYKTTRNKKMQINSPFSLN